MAAPCWSLGRRLARAISSTGVPTGTDAALAPFAVSFSTGLGGGAWSLVAPELHPGCARATTATSDPTATRRCGVRAGMLPTVRLLTSVRQRRYVRAVTRRTGAILGVLWLCATPAHAAGVRIVS